MIETRRRSLLMCKWRLEKLGWWTLELLVVLRNVHLRQVWVAAYAAWMLLLVRWLGEVAALSRLLLLLLQKQGLFVVEAGWCALRSSAMRHFIAKHGLLLLTWWLLRSIAE
jgi:hypothetical protein